MLGWFRKPGERQEKTRDLSPHFSTKHADNLRHARARVGVIRDYSRFLGQIKVAPGDIVDARVLPHPKEEILDAITMEIIVTDDAEQLAQLGSAAIWLADFQEGVGAEPLSMLGVELPTSNVTDAEAFEIAKKINNNPNRERYERVSQKVREDSAHIQAKLDAAEQLRQIMPEQKKRDVLGKGLRM